MSPTPRSAATVSPQTSLLHPASMHGRFGAIDVTGRLVIQPQFDSLLSFSEGLAAFENGGLWGVIDSHGDVVCAPQYEGICRFSNGYARVERAGLYGFIDRCGALAIPPRFAQTDDFSHGLAAVQETEVSKTGFIDGSGSFRIPAQFFHADGFSEGLAQVRYETRSGGIGSSGYISTDGAAAIPPRFSLAHQFSEGLAAVAEDDQGELFGFIDPAGTYQLPPKWSGADIRFSQGLAAVWSEEGFGYIDRGGRLTIPYSFYFADHFAGGFGVVGLRRKRKTLYGFINRDGEFVIEPIFTGADGFCDGLAYVSIGERAGYVNLRGDWVWEHS